MKVPSSVVLDHMELAACKKAHPNEKIRPENLFTAKAACSPNPEQSGFINFTKYSSGTLG